MKMIIKNFVVIKEAIYEPKWFNVIIGEQTSGKSLIVKLDYFFKEIVFEELFISIIKQYVKTKFIENIKKRFFKYFNKNLVLNSAFEIEYYYNEDFFIKFYKNKNSLKIETSKIFDNYRNNLKREFKKYANDENKLSEKLINIQDEISEKFNYVNNTFIPAGRSFFANIDTNIFTILADNGKIDPFLIEFGKELEFTKFILPKNENLNFENFEKILKAKVFLDEKSEFFLNMNDTKFDLIYASSAQQELLPIIITILFKEKRNIFVEEPEAHLFPSTQKNLIELLTTMAYKNNFTSLTITTHSPYIITALNNLILASEVNIPKNSSLYYLKKIAIPIDKITAYSLENYKLKNILNKEENLIDGYNIDKISDEFAEVFDNLLEYMNNNKALKND